MTHGVKESDEDDLILEENQILFTRDDRRYRIRGLERNQSMINPWSKQCWMTRSTLDSFLVIDLHDEYFAAGLNGRAWYSLCYY